MPILNLTPPPSDGNPRKLTAWAFNNAWLIAQDRLEATDEMFKSAIEAEGGPASMRPATLPFTPNVVEPQVFIPFMAEGASVAKFYELSTMVINQLADLYGGWMTTYLKDTCGYNEKAQQWVCNTLTNGGTGLNPLVERMIWERERDRTTREANRSEREILTKWAARGYPLAPGVAHGQILQMHRDRGAALSQASRDLAVKQMELEIENVRFAVEWAQKSYATAYGAAGDYIKALSIGPNSAMQVVPSVTDSQSRLISATTDLYRARTGVEELRMKSLMAPAEWEQQSRVKNGEWLMEQIKLQVNAAVEAARNVGTQAAATLNSLHANTGVTNGTSDSVNYSYSNDTVDAAPTVTSIV